MVFASSQTHNRLVITVFLFLLFGHVMLFSATGVLGLQQHDSEFYYLARQGLIALLGLAMMFLLAHIRYQVWEKLAVALIVFQIVLVAATFLGSFSHAVQGVSRWIRWGPVQFQPSEAAKITLAIYASYLLCRWQAGNLAFKPMAFFVIPIFMLLLLIFRQPDLGSTILLAGMLVGLCFVAGTKPIYILSFIGVGGVAFALSMFRSAYQHRRLMAFLNPWADPQGSGFQTIQSFLSFHSGKVFGVGLGNGNSKLFFLPEVHTDFIFSLIGEELGFIGAIALLAGFVYLTHLLLKIVRYAPDSFGRFLAFGLSLSLIFQILVNLGGVTGILPVKGLPLPFISWGRSALLVNLSMVGILLNVAKQSAIISPKKKSGGRVRLRSSSKS